MRSHIVDIILPNSRVDNIGDPSWRKYKLIPVHRDVRGFFPGYEEHFVLQTNVGDVEAWVTSARRGVEVGDPDAGQYICTPRKTQRVWHGLHSLSDWYNQHSELEPGDVVCTVYESPMRYRLSVELNYIFNLMKYKQLTL